MSYILDALRRAEAQREQQTATPPGLGHPAVVAPPAALAESAEPGAMPPTRATAGRGGWLGGLAVGGGVALALVMALQAMRPAAPPATPTPAAAVPAQVSPPPAQPVPPAVAAALSPAPILQPAPAAPPAADRPAPPARSAPAAAEAVPRYADLPEPVRSALPALSVQGVTWSENPAWRHLIVNGRVLQEGQSIGPGHVLEQIGPDSSVLNHRGQRYRIGH